MIATIKDGVLTIQPETRKEADDLTVWGCNYYINDEGAELVFLFPPDVRESNDVVNLQNLEEILSSVIK